GEPLDERHEAVDGAARLRAERSARRERSRSRLPQRAAVRPGTLAQRLEALRSAAAWRQVDHAREGGIVAAVGQEPEIRERVLDLGALEEPQPAVDPVRDARRQERLLEHPRLRVGAVEDRDLAPRAPARDVLADAVGHELRLVPLVEGGVEADRLATRTGRPQLLAEAAGVVPDEPVGGFQDGAGGAVVLLEAEQLRPRVVAAELLEMPGARAPEAVNRLIVVADHERIAAARRSRGWSGRCRRGAGLRRREQPHPLVLDGVGVLELIDQHVLEAPPVVRKERGVVAPQLEGAQQQLREVHDARARARGLVRGVEPDQLTARRIVLVLELPRAAAFVLVGIDVPLHLARHPARLVELRRPDDLLDEALLILGVEDLKALSEVRLAPVQPQQPVRNAVKGADPQSAARHTEQPLDATAHLPRRLVGEGHGQDAVGRDALGLDQPRDAVRQHPGLAAAGPGEHQHRAERRGDRGALSVVQRIEDRGQIHGGRILPGKPAGSAPAVRLQCSCAKRTSATAKESSTGPITSPRMPKAAAPPIAPTKIASVDTSTCCAVRSGRSTFSTIHSAAVQQARKIAAPQRPLKARYSTAGMSTALAPAGRKAAMVPSTPNTTGDGRPTSAKPAPTKSPWMSAVTAEPNTTARVTSRRYRMRRARREPSPGMMRVT